MKRSLLLLGLVATISQTLKSQKVTLDYFFNHEILKKSDGTVSRYHYMWEDTSNGGFSILGSYFKANGASLNSLDESPDAANLQSTSIYIIVDPDDERETTKPNFIDSNSIREITSWVKKGGILVLFANDSKNVELAHFNRLAEKFGFHFNSDLQNEVIDDNHFENGAIYPSDNKIFKTAKKIFIKNACSITTTKNAVSSLKNNQGAILMATCTYGNGFAIAIGDPWLYNEYVNGRLPVEFENDKAASDLVKWLLAQHLKKRRQH